MPEGSAGGNGGLGDGTNGDAQRRALPDDIRATLQEFFELNKIPDSQRKIFHQNAKLRHKNAELRTENDQLKAAKPKDGTVVLSKEDGAEYEAFKKLNIKAADVTTLVKEHGELKAKDVARENETLHADVAEALGYPNVAALSKSLKRERLHVEMKAERIDDPENPGKKITVNVPYVRPIDKPDAQLEKASDYIERELFDVEPVFLIEPEEIEAGEGEEGDEEEMAGVGTSRGSRSERPAPRTRRIETRESVVNGLAMPLHRGSRPSSGAARNEKAEREFVEKKRVAGGYGL